MNRRTLGGGVNPNKLREIKQHWDPDNFFNWPQGIRLPAQENETEGSSEAFVNEEALTDQVALQSGSPINPRPRPTFTEEPCRPCIRTRGDISYVSYSPFGVGSGLIFGIAICFVGKPGKYLECQHPAIVGPSSLDKSTFVAISR